MARSVHASVTSFRLAPHRSLLAMVVSPKFGLTLQTWPLDASVRVGVLMAGWFGSGHFEDNLAGRAARLTVPVGSSRLVDREDAVDERSQAAGFDKGSEGSQARRVGLD